MSLSGGIPVADLTCRHCNVRCGDVLCATCRKTDSKRIARAALVPLHMIVTEDSDICPKCEERMKHRRASTCVPCMPVHDVQYACYDCDRCVATRAYLRETDDTVFRLMGHGVTNYGTQAEFWQCGALRKVHSVSVADAWVDARRHSRESPQGTPQIRMSSESGNKPDASGAVSKDPRSSMMHDDAPAFEPIVWTPEQATGYLAEQWPLPGDVQQLRPVATEHQRAIVDVMQQHVPRLHWPHSLAGMFWRSDNVFYVFHHANAMEYLPQWFVEEYLCDDTADRYPELRNAVPIPRLQTLSIE